MKRAAVFVLGVAAFCAACGGSKKTAAGPEPGTEHETKPAVAADAGVTGEQPPGAPEEMPRQAVLPPLPDAGPPPPPYTFKLQNDGDTDVVFALDKGWQYVIFAYTGKPPKAKPALLFPSYCTESCDADAAKMCPVCREPTDPKEIKKHEKEETKRETAPAHGSFDLPWDGKVFVYEKAPKAAAKKKKKCECWRKVDPPADTYTIKACGLRPSTKAGEPSKPVCAQTEVQLPAATTPATVTLSLPK